MRGEQNNAVTFFFGSGADTDCCKSLPSGQAFAKSMFQSRYLDERKKLLGEDCGAFQLVHSNSRKVFLQSIFEHSEEANAVFGKAIVQNCNRYYEYNYSDGEKLSDDEKKKLQNDIKQYCKKWYDMLNAHQSEDSRIAKFFYDYGVFFECLDEKFNALRNFQNSNKAKRVMNAYATVFILMLETLYQIPEDFAWNYSAVFDLLHREYNNVSKDEQKSYYALLKKATLTYNVVTTNYTSLAEQVIGQKPIYLHGKLTWFEDLKHLSVYDCTEKTQREAAERNSENLIPFILIPSGVKPLICTKQIEAFHDFIEKLDHSDFLVVVGYRFNSEDNHVNSIIVNWLRTSDKRRLLYLNFKQDGKKSVDLESLGWIGNDFHVTEIDGKNLNDKHFENRILSIVSEGNICHEVFQKICAYLETSESRKNI